MARLAHRRFASSPTSPAVPAPASLSAYSPAPPGRYRASRRLCAWRSPMRSAAGWPSPFSVAGDVSVTLPTSRVPSLPSRLCPAPHQRLPHFRCRSPTCLPLTMPPSPPPLPQVALGPVRVLWLGSGCVWVRYVCGVHGGCFGLCPRDPRYLSCLCGPVVALLSWWWC